jgi:hypothetical protein
MKTQYSKKKILKLAGAGALVLTLGIGAAGAFASNSGGQSVQEKIQTLLNRLKTETDNELKNGQFKDTPQGKVFAGESADKMKKLHDETRDQIDSLTARPESERQKAVDKIKKFAKDESAQVQYKITAKSAYNSNVLEEVYTMGLDQYEIDSRNNTIIQFGPRPRNIDEAPKQFDTTARFSKNELETMARQFITENAPEVKLNDLSPKFSDKEGINYFFRWEDDSRIVEEMHPFIQVGFSRGGDVVSYVNTIGL